LQIKEFHRTTLHKSNKINRCASVDTPFTCWIPQRLNPKKVYDVELFYYLEQSVSLFIWQQKVREDLFAVSQLCWQKAAAERGRAGRGRSQALGVGGIFVLDSRLFAQPERRPKTARRASVVENAARRRVPANHV